MNAPFDYPLNLTFLEKNKSIITLCCHGYGSNSSFVSTLSSAPDSLGSLIGFNFPDFDITQKSENYTSTFGTFEEIAPLLYLLKFYTENDNVEVLNLYGFSAGGGAVINALSILHNHQHPEKLLWLGITPYDTQSILNKLKKGHIILDCPLKSIQEIIDFRGISSELKVLAERYKKNNMNPIDTLISLKGINLSIFLHFQENDEILSNRDDKLFIERLKKANNGFTYFFKGNDGGHNVLHSSFFNFYRHQNSLTID